MRVLVCLIIGAALAAEPALAAAPALAAEPPVRPGAPISSHAMLHTCCTPPAMKERLFAESKAMGARLRAALHAQHGLELANRVAGR